MGRRFRVNDVMAEPLLPFSSSRRAKVPIIADR